jgi:hypothetical protein
MGQLAEQPTAFGVNDVSESLESWDRVWPKWLELSLTGKTQWMRTGATRDDQANAGSSAGSIEGNVEIAGLPILCRARTHRQHHKPIREGCRSNLDGTKQPRERRAHSHLNGVSWADDARVASARGTANR